MSRTEHTASRQRTVVAVGLGVGLVVVVVGGLLLRENAPGNMGNGFIAGGSLALAGAALTAWRSVRRPADTSPFERAFTQSGDERDDLVLTRALAVVGAASLPGTGVAAVAIALDVDPAMVMALLVFGLLGLLAGSYVVLSRRY